MKSGWIIFDWGNILVFVFFGAKIQKPMKKIPSFFRPAIILTILLCMTGKGLEAQIVKKDSTSNWLKVFKAGVNINQANFSSNWKAGGVNSFGFNAH